MSVPVAVDVHSIRIDVFVNRKLRQITVTVAIASLALLLFLINVEHNESSIQQ